MSALSRMTAARVCLYVGIACLVVAIGSFVAYMLIHYFAPTVIVASALGLCAAVWVWAERTK